MAKLEYVKEPEIPFPQANSMGTCISLIKFLQEWIKTTENIANYCKFTDRQSGYYTSACKYLWLVQDFKRWGYQLTELGKEVAVLPDKELKYKFIELILEHKVFNEVFQIYNIREITAEEVVEIMENNNLYNIDSYDTYKRRSSTILAWCEWIKKTSKEEGFSFKLNIIK